MTPWRTETLRDVDPYGVGWELDDEPIEEQDDEEAQSDG